jgi:hypothetical protein
MRAIDLANDYAALMNLVENNDEFTPEMIADTLEGCESALTDKFDAIMALIKNAESMASACDKESKRLEERKKMFNKKSGDLKKYIIDCLNAANVKTLKSDFHTFTRRKGSPSLIIDNESLIPPDFINTSIVTTPDKKAIKEALEKGVKIKGAHIEIGPETLHVR